MTEVSWPQQGQKTGSSILQKVPVANGSGWYLKKGRSALIEISFQPYKSHFVVALLYIHFSKNESDFLYFLFIKTKLEQGSGKYLIGEDSCLTTSFNEGRHRAASKAVKVHSGNLLHRTQKGVV